MKTLSFFLNPLTLVALVLLLCPVAINAQINLRSLSSFILFTTAGAIDNTGTTKINGDIGTNDGDISGFEPPSVVSGSSHDADGVTGQGILDLADICAEITATITTNAVHAPAFGNGETLAPGVYEITGAASIVDTLWLDAQGISSSSFIFKVGGAFTTAAGATVMLLNGAKAENIFWKATGAIAMAALTTMKGTMIADVGAASMGAGGKIEGRLFSNTGAVSTYQVTAFLPGLFILPVTLLEFKGALEYPLIKLRWKISNEISFAEYQIERSSDAKGFYSVGKIASINTAGIKTYLWTDNSILNGSNFYRLKMIDINGAFKYSAIVNIDVKSSKEISVFPNPVTGNSIQLRMYGQPKGEYIINLFDTNGKKIKTSKITHDGIDAIRSITVGKNLSSSYYLEVNNAGGIKKTIRIFIK